MVKNNLSQKIEHLQDAFPFFLFSMLVFSPALVVSSTAISGVFASSTDASAKTLTGDAFEPISSRLAYSTTGFSATCLAASSAFFFSASTL